MSAASSAARQVLTASHHAVGRRGSLTTTSRRTMSAAAALPLPEDRSPIDLPIFDIFDAPSRLGESSKMLRQSAAARVERAVAQAVDRSAPVRPAVQPLPAPVMYDGPARPSSLGHGAHVRRMHSQASSESDVAFTLPEPEVFDGPSRLRPYLREDSSGDAASYATTLVGAAAAGAFAYAAYDQLTAKPGRGEKTQRI